METLVAIERQRQFKEMLKGECNVAGKCLQVKASRIFLKSRFWTSLADIYLSVS